VGGEILQRLRHAVAFQILRRGADHAMAWGEAAGDEAGIVEFRDADGKVDSFADDIDDIVRQMQFEIEFGMLLKERGQIRRHMATAEAGRRGDAQRAAGFGVELGHEGLGFLDVAEDADDPLVEALARFGELELARGALKQARAEPLFHMADALAHHSRGKAHVAPGGGHVSRCRDARKYFEIRNRGNGHAVALARLMFRTETVPVKDSVDRLRRCQCGNRVKSHTFRVNLRRAN
jgi:hypothetical protein